MGEGSPIVSIVLPSYNGAKYIQESIDSVLGQTFPSWELILVDDCSTDETAAIAASYAAKDSRIRVIHNAVNQRLPRSLNIGFREARGKYLTWTSDDNRYLPRAIEVMVRALDVDPATPMVCAAMDYIDASGTVLGRADAYEDDLIWVENRVGACFLYRREALSQVGGYDPAKVYVEDYDYWLRLRAAMGEIRRISETLYQYRLHEASLTTQKEREVWHQRGKLYLTYQAEIFRDCQNDPKLLCAMYYDFLLSDLPDTAFLRAIYDRLPELHHEAKEIPRHKPIFVFGAGALGEKAAALFGTRVIGFIDNDPAKSGEEKAGRPILSLETYQKQGAGGALLVVAVGVLHIYEILRQILGKGIETFGTYQRIVGQRERQSAAHQDGR